MFLLTMTGILIYISAGFKFFINRLKSRVEVVYSAMWGRMATDKGYQMANFKQKFKELIQKYNFIQKSKMVQKYNLWRKEQKQQEEHRIDVNTGKADEFFKIFYDILKETDCQYLLGALYFTESPDSKRSFGWSDVFRVEYKYNRWKRKFITAKLYYKELHEIGFDGKKQKPEFQGIERSSGDMWSSCTSVWEYKFKRLVQDKDQYRAAALGQFTEQVKTA